MKHHILVATDERLSPALLEALRAQGAEAAFAEDGWQETAFPPEAVDAVIGRQILDRWTAEAFPNLRFVQVMSAGLDHVPVDDLRRRGILLANGRGLLSPYIAEWILAQVLDSTRCLDYFKARQRAHEWVGFRVEAPVITLLDKTACIVGPGSIGRAAAHRLKAFGMHVIAVNRSPVRDCPDIDETYPLDRMEEALARSLVVAVTIPLTPETTRLIGPRALDAMGDDAIFLNCSRGAVVDEAALIERLRRGKFRRAALDVFEREPLPADSPLWDFPNVVVSPHESPRADGQEARRERFALENLYRYLRGEIPENLIR